ncbi:type III-B CRISPR module RAMP protein Cmr1 [Methanococcus voltae]|uniref:CRISPR-associated RAMP protein, Cmr1 family n=1 Tax=Methanococcus voltae (strain ATCC BAA-1334 / A3) TaxID=456320 RepID=D7DSV5_METV3|nr:type III-B CRISPR module RAMP protein Cmr1 [Methanococcus voltae]MCS3901815.1 CRISPR-associated protein Cmr1 [Methanococcus voltae]
MVENPYETLNFNCEIISPIFCYGADKESPEIRASSIRGALRFWWRALQPELTKEEFEKFLKETFDDAYALKSLLGKVSKSDKYSEYKLPDFITVDDIKKFLTSNTIPKNTDVIEKEKIQKLIRDIQKSDKKLLELYYIYYMKNLRKKEFEIFGGVDGDKAFKSKVYVNIMYTTTKNETGKDTLNIYSKKYLGHKNFKKDAFESGKFKITLHLQKNSNMTLEQLKSLFIIYTILGGVGGRTRRGAGCFRLTDDFSIINKSTMELLKENFEKLGISEYYNFSDERILIKNTPTSKSRPIVKEITIKPIKKPLDGILGAIGDITHKHKNYYNGHTKNGERYASPSCISLFKKENAKNNDYELIITKLSGPHDEHNKGYKNSAQDTFCGAIRRDLND